MKCKKCGNEIKEGNNFCTECGRSINYSIKSKLKDYKVLIIITLIWLICMIIFMSLKINGSKKDTTTIDKNTALEDAINSDKNESLNEDSSDIDVSDDEVNVNVEDKQDQDEQEDKSSTNKQENSNNSNSEDKQTSNSNNQNENNSSNSNSDNDEEYQDTTVMLTHKQLENKTEQELKTLLTSKGLVPKVVSKTEEIAYSDDLANTTKSTVKLQLGNEGNNFYKKGDTVEIINTYYKPISWTANLYYNVESASFNVFGKTCYAYNKYSDKNYGVFCFRENPTELNTFDLLHSGRARGVELYINDEHIGNGKGYYEFTFNNVETITLKVVAPYVYEYNEDGSERTVLGTDVVVYEKKLNVKELYKSMRGNIVDLEIK